MGSTVKVVDLSNMRENVGSTKNHYKENNPMKSMSPTDFIFRKEGKSSNMLIEIFSSEFTQQLVSLPFNHSSV